MVLHTNEGECILDSSEQNCITNHAINNHSLLTCMHAYMHDGGPPSPHNSELRSYKTYPLVKDVKSITYTIEIPSAVLVLISNFLGSWRLVTLFLVLSEKDNMGTGHRSNRC